MFKWNSFCVSLCLLPPSLSLGTTEELGSAVFAPSHQIFLHVDKIFLSLVRSSCLRLNAPNTLSLPSWGRRPSFSITSVPFAGLTLVRPRPCRGEPGSGRSALGVPPVLGRGEGSPPLACWWCLAWCSPGHCCLCCKDTWLAGGQLVLPRAFPAKLLARWLAPACAGAGPCIQSITSCVPHKDTS